LRKKCKEIGPVIKANKIKIHSLFQTIQDLKSKKIENKTLYQSERDFKALMQRNTALAKIYLKYKSKAKYIKKKYLTIPKTHAYRQIPPFFRYKQVAVMKKLVTYWMTYNINVIPNWVDYLKVKLHDYKKEEALATNNYISEHKLWKEYSEKADKA